MSTDLVKNIVQKDIVPGMSMLICVMENIAGYKTKHNGDIKEALKDYKSDFDALEEMIGAISSQIDLCGKSIDAMRTAARASNAAAIAARRSEMAAM